MIFQLRSTHLLPLLLIAILTLSCGQDQPSEKKQKPTTFILVRHAEKADNGTNDPPLNEIGKQRATALANHLKETNITAIYSTDYKRTRQTVQQIANTHGLVIKSYDPSKDTAIQEIINTEGGSTVLISGHSNTTPLLVNKLIGEERYQQFDDSDYDNLLILMAKEVGKGTVIKLTF